MRDQLFLLLRHKAMTYTSNSVPILLMSFSNISVSQYLSVKLLFCLFVFWSIMACLTVSACLYFFLSVFVCLSFHLSIYLHSELPCLKPDRPHVVFSSRPARQIRSSWTLVFVFSR